MQNIYHQTVASPSAELYVVSLWFFFIQIEINFDANGCCHILNYMDFVLNVIRLHAIHIFVWFFYICQVKNGGSAQCEIKIFLFLFIGSVNWWNHIYVSYSDYVFLWSVYRQVSNIRRTKSQHSQDSRTVLWLSLPNPLKPDIKSRMKM